MTEVVARCLRVENWITGGKKWVSREYPLPLPYEGAIQWPIKPLALKNLERSRQKLIKKLKN